MRIVNRWEPIVIAVRTQLTFPAPSQVYRIPVKATLDLEINGLLDFFRAFLTVSRVPLNICPIRPSSGNCNWKTFYS